LAIFIVATGSNINCTYYTDDFYSDSCRTTAAVAATLGFIGGSSWIACAICTFVFSCGQRYKKYHLDDEDENQGRGNGRSPGPTDTVVSAYPIHSTGPKILTKEDTDEPSALSNGTSINKVITHLPDGSIKTETETILPNGKKQVTTTIEKPAPSDIEVGEE
jgi:hypothetical protein